MMAERDLRWFLSYIKVWLKLWVWTKVPSSLNIFRIAIHPLERCLFFFSSDLFSFQLLL